MTTAALPTSPAGAGDERSLLDRMTAALGAPAVRDELRATPLQSWVTSALPEDWRGASTWDAGPSWVWALSARPSQLVPKRPHRVLLLRSGRAWGKNRCAAETVNDVADQAGHLIAQGQLRPEEARILLVGRSAEDVRDAMIGGPSGIVARSRPWNRAAHEPGRRRVVWGSGVEALAFSSAEPSQLRGQNGIFAWCDEVASWGHLEESWVNVEMAVRLGPIAPKILCTTTPRPLPWLRALIARLDTIDVCRPTRDNEKNLSEGTVDQLYSQYAGTWIGAQELDGQILDGAAASYFPRADVTIIDEAPTDLQQTVRRWDLAATLPSPDNRDPDWSCGVKMGRRSNGRFVVLHAVLVRERAGQVEDLIKRTAEHDGRATTILLPQDPGQAGKAQVEDLTRKLAGFAVQHERETGDKATRATPFSSQWTHHNVDVVRGPWNEQFFGQMEAFPNVWAHDDAPDAAAGAFNFLSKPAHISMFDPRVSAGLARLVGGLGDVSVDWRGGRGR